MPARDVTPAGAPCWIDLMTSDLARSRDFYRQLFGWTADEPNPEFGGYFNFRRDGVLVAGCMANQPENGVPDLWSVYLASPDATKTAETASANGAHVIVPPMAVGDLGSMAVVADPTGAGIGIWQPSAHPGFGVVTEPGAPSWFELHSTDYQKTLDFYRAAFDWETQEVSDTPELRYTTLVRDGESLAGVMDASGWDPAPCQRWAVYFGAEDTETALNRVVELGGTVVSPAMDTPYGVIGAAADPTGAEFRLVAANEAMPAKS